MSIYTQLAYWVLSYIGHEISLSSSAVKSKRSRGGGGGGLQHVLTVHPLMLTGGAVYGWSWRYSYFLLLLND